MTARLAALLAFTALTIALAAAWLGSLAEVAAVLK